MARELYLRSTMSVSLVTPLASHVQLAIPARLAQHSALAYAGATVASPLSVAMLAFSACVGVGYTGVLGAVVLCALVVAIAIATSCSRRVRRVLDGHFEFRAKTRRVAERQRLLRGAGPVRQHQYAELRDLVSEIERVDPAEVERFELAELLDTFVRLIARHQRCLEWMRRAGGNDLPVVAPSSLPSKRRDLLTRRIRHREECMARIARLVDDIESIDELVHLIAQRGACPPEDLEVARDIERRMWELDEVDAALAQMSA
jgi:hypothetical protein